MRTPQSVMEELFRRVPLGPEHAGIFVYSCPCDQAVVFPISRFEKAALNVAIEKAKRIDDTEPLREAVRSILGEKSMNSIGQFMLEHYYHGGPCVFGTFDVPASMRSNNADSSKN